MKITLYEEDLELLRTKGVLCAQADKGKGMVEITYEDDGE